MNTRYQNRSGNKAESADGEVIRVRTPKRELREVLGTVTEMLGGSRVIVQCMDSVKRMCRIRGKMRKRSWVREGDTVIVVPWEIQDSKGDIVWRYTAPQAHWLEKKGYLHTI